MAIKTGNNLANRLIGTSGADTLSGAGGNDTLEGLGGNDVLNGGTGNDSMAGGAGNDTYHVDSLSDRIIETATGGTADTVLASISYTLATTQLKYIEHLTLTGAALNATGNDLANRLTGNTKANKLVGGKGNDTLSGGGANDTLDGGIGNDSLDGGLGADSLQGGTGNDVLVWDAADLRVDGGTNTAPGDTLKLTGTVALDLATEDTPIDGIEAFDLAGTHTLTLAPTGVKNLSDSSDTLLVKGGSDDAVLAGNGWAHLFSHEEGGQTYAEYVKEGATVRVDLDVDRAGVIVAEMSLGVLDGSNGFELAAGPAADCLGAAISGAGDVNGDGFEDFVVGASRVGTGTAYVVFGKGGGFSDLDLSTLGGSGGFILGGNTGYAFAGGAVSAAGDVNGDGLADIIVGASGYYGARGAAYVVFGKTSGLVNADLSAMDAGDGFRITGAAINDGTGGSVSGAGDFNGDGYDDLFVGAPGHGDNTEGAVYVVFGGPAGSVNLELSALGADEGFAILGDTGYAGSSVSSAGDINGDGCADIILGAPFAGPYDEGTSYVIFGKPGVSADIELSGLAGTDGFRILGGNSYDVAGVSVSGAGDFNGDGISDLIVGSSGNSAYVIFGASSGLGDVILSDLGEAGFRIDAEGVYDSLGGSVSGAGDVNGDGYDDLLIGASGVATDKGAAYVMFGHAGAQGNFNVSQLDGANGFQLSSAQAGDGAGAAVSSAGDLDGDGYADILIGTPAFAADGGGGYAVLGRDFANAVTHQGTAGADNLTGTAGADVIVGGRGDDALIGGGGADVFRGGEGDDRIEIADGDFADVDGGGNDHDGGDTLALADGLDLDLTGIEDSEITGIEAIEMAGGMLTLDKREVLNLSDTSNTVRVAGTGTLDAGEGWSFDGSSEGGAFVRYTNGAAVLEVASGIDSGLEPEIFLAGLDGTKGFQISGEAVSDFSGFSVASAGDVNGDGFADLIIGARYAGPTDAGASYVVFGKASGFASNLDLSGLDGANGFAIPGKAAGDQSGWSVSSAGDVNGDGVDDLIVGARWADAGGNYSGASYVVFGKASGFGSTLNLTSLDGSNGFQIAGEAGYDESGRAVSGAGDVNGDGFDDVIIGAQFADPHGGLSGATHVVFGKATGFGASLHLSSLTGANGFQLSGEAGNDRSGHSVSAAGDVNGDGIADLIIGAYVAAASAGASYVVFGQASGFGAELDLSSLTGSNGFRITGEASNDNSGWSVSGAGDINGDGYDDVIVGTNGGGDSNGANAGSSHVVFGKASSAFGANLNLSGLAASDGFRIAGETDADLTGYSVSSAGDVNGDGYDDLIVGGPIADPHGVSAGASYVVFGKASGFGSNLELSGLDGANGFQLNGEAAGDRSGFSVAAAGDVNGDGFADLIIGASHADPNASESGASYVVLGRDFGDAAADDLVTGTGAGELVIGGAGDDTMNGNGGADIFRGGEGNDRIVIGDAGFLDLDGGGDEDTLVLGSGVDLDLTAIADGEITGMEAIDLGGTGNALTLNLREVLNLSDTSNVLTIEGGATDEVTATESWSGGAQVGDYYVYTLGAATLKVSVDLAPENIHITV